MNCGDDLGQLNRQKEMDIADWLDTPRPVVAKRRDPVARSSRLLKHPMLIGMLGTVLLHSLLIPSVFLESRAQRTQSPEIQEPSALAESDSRHDLVLVSLGTLSDQNRGTTQELPALPDLRIRVLKSQIDSHPPSPAIVPLTLGEEQLLKRTATSGDEAEQGRLFGIYTGQIKARIERIWRRPRTAVNDTESKGSGSADESFQCEAQIVQDSSGNVQEILLPRCNGSSAWQQSLISAIREASPLPAPPSASVFSQSIALSFVGLSYAPGVLEDGYEISPHQSEPAADFPVRTALKANLAN
jgi:hypothetical protein